jgi:hypothetical protein
MANGVKLIGQDILEKHIKRMSDAPKVFDNDFRKTATNAVGNLKEKTPQDTHNTARAWSDIKKSGLSNYSIENRSATESSGGKRYSLIRILNDGRKEVKPVRAKSLYIPLTNKGKSRDKSSVFGIDFCFC